MTKPAPPPTTASVTKPVATTYATAITPTITSCSIREISRPSPKFPFLIPSTSSKISLPDCESQCESSYWIPELFLYHSDKRILSSSSQWINDAIINGAQMLLKQQADDSYLGLQSTLLGKGLQFKVVKRDDKPLVQILHINNHWVTVTTVGCAADEIQIYDSLYSYVSLNLKQQICSFLRPQEHNIKFLCVDMQHQSDTNSCGLFAIAVATELVTAGGNPATCKWDKERMRHHLRLCFERKELKPFPRIGERRVHPSSRFKQVVTEKIYCECRMPRDPRIDKDMIECVKCMQLFHKECCGVRDLPERGKYWACRSCQ